MSAHRESRITTTDFSLRSFAELQLATGNEWADYLKVQGARPPKLRTTLREGFPVTTEDDPSPEYASKVVLHADLIARLKAAIQSADWEVLAIAPGATGRTPVALDLALGTRDISFLENRMGRLTLVQIVPSSSDDRYLQTKRFIEIVCSVIPAKKGVIKGHIQDLADRLLPFSVRDDHFKVAWDNADKPDAWTKPGP